MEVKEITTTEKEECDDNCDVCREAANKEMFIYIYFKYSMF